MHHTEAAILRDIRQNTGLRLDRLQQLNKHDENQTSKALPILRTWVPRIGESNIRSAIYQLFATPLADPFLGDLLHWWKTDTVPLSGSVLSQCLAAVANASNAAQIWDTWVELDRKPQDSYFLLARLATFEGLSGVVEEEIVRALYEEKLTNNEMYAISRLKDRRVREWFLERTEKGEYFVRELARRIASQKKKLPSVVQVAATVPDKAFREIYSTEVDLFEVKDVLTLFSSPCLNRPYSD